MATASKFHPAYTTMSDALRGVETAFRAMMVKHGVDVKHCHVVSRGDTAAISVVDADYTGAKQVDLHMPFVPPTAKVSRSDIDMFTASWLHEGWHAIRTDFDVYQKACQVNLGAMVNAFEDVVIDRWGVDNSGFPNARKLRSERIETMAQRNVLQGWHGSDEQWALWSIKAFGLTRLAGYDCPTVDQIWNDMPAVKKAEYEAILARVAACQNTADCLELARSLRDEQTIDFEPPVGPGTPCDDGEDDGENEGENSNPDSNEGSNDDDNAEMDDDGTNAGDDDTGDDESGDNAGADSGEAGSDERENGDDGAGDDSTETDADPTQPTSGTEDDTLSEGHSGAESDETVTEGSDTSEDGSVNPEQTSDASEGSEGVAPISFGNLAGSNADAGLELTQADVLHLQSDDLSLTAQEALGAYVPGVTFDDGELHFRFNRRGGTYLEPRVTATQIPARLRSIILGLLRAPERSDVRRYRTSGRFDRRALMRTKRGAVDVFTTKTRHDGTTALVNLVIDCSSSMAGQDMANAARMGWALAKAIEAAGVSCEVQGFTTPRGDNTLTKDGDLDAFALQAGFIPVKTRNERCAKVAENFEMLGRASGGGTPMAPAIIDTAKRMSAERATRRIMVVLTDGDCATREGGMLEAQRLAWHYGVEVVGIGVGIDVSKAFYVSQKFKTSAELATGVMRKLIEQLNKPKGATLERVA